MKNITKTHGVVAILFVLFLGLFATSSASASYVPCALCGGAPVCFGGALSNSVATTFLNGSTVVAQGVCTFGPAASNTGTVYCGTGDASVNGTVGAHQGFPLAAGVLSTLTSSTTPIVVCASDASGDSVFGCCQ